MTLSTVAAPNQQADPDRSATAAPRTSGSALTADFNTFLQMLTAQARYQDPLEPIDSTEYSAQLAQFSMVEQQLRTNDMLAALSARMGSTDMASLSGWIGMEARAAIPLAFDGAPVTVSVRTDALADSAFLVVFDASGAEVQRRAIPLNADTIEWAGVAGDGTPLASGVYTFTVQSYVNGEIIRSDPAEVYGHIVEAQVRNGETVVILQGGQAVAAAEITALRSPGLAGE
ncbi:MAG: flagellar hook capping FlgD N-terminal domain-containing protein [Jhaorihella sp.]